MNSRKCEVFIGVGQLEVELIAVVADGSGSEAFFIMCESGVEGISVLSC